MSHEADSFFDFDCETESPGSPAEECEYSRLIETTSVTPNDFASESGYICSSPLSLENESQNNSHSSSDGPYFDPESSDADQKSLPTDYFDCDESKIDDTFNSTIILNGHHNNDNSESVSSESLPPSQESTSTTNTTTIATPSSLTSINTDVSSSSENTLQDIIINELQKQNIESNTTHHNSYHHNETTNIDEVDSNTKLIDNKPNLENLCLEEKISLNESNDIKKLAIPSQKVTEASPEKESQPIVNNLKSDESSTKNQHLSISDYDDDDCRPQRIQRSSSLKTGKTPPGTPGRKKIVRFADVLGLDLADIKTFLDEVPTIPKSAYEDLELIEAESQQPPIQLGPKIDKILLPLFQQPGGLPNFLDVVRDKQVSLENAIVSDAYNLTISGCVRVRNLDFHKSVYIRYTLDNWKSFADLQANYIENSCDGFSDKFSFILFGNSLIIGQRLEFAVRFHCKGQQYWDNNSGANYCFQCLPSSNTNFTSRLISSSTSLPPPSISAQNIDSSTILNQSDPWCNSFY